MSETLELGKLARDRITGFQGTVAAKTIWLHGCVRYGLQAHKLKEDGTPSEVQWFDTDQLEIVAETQKPPTTTTGGPRPVETG